MNRHVYVVVCDDGWGVFSPIRVFTTEEVAESYAAMMGAVDPYMHYTYKEFALEDDV
jgi:hypothetical protein